MACSMQPATVICGSAGASQGRDHTAGKPPPKLSDQIADVRSRQWQTQTCTLGFSEAAGGADGPLLGFVSVKRALVTTRTQP